MGERTPSMVPQLMPVQIIPEDWMEKVGTAGEIRAETMDMVNPESLKDLRMGEGI